MTGSGKECRYVTQDKDGRGASEPKDEEWLLPAACRCSKVSAALGEKERSKKGRFSTGQQSFLINKRAKEATRWGVLGRERACAIHRYDCSGVFVWREARIRAPGLGIGVGCANQTARVALTFSFNQGSPERLSKATS